MAATAWSTQEWAAFVAAVSAADSEASAALAAVERAADALDADVAAIVDGGNVLAAVGYPRGAAPAAELEAVTPEFGGSLLEVPGAGMCPAAAAMLEHPPEAKLVVARAGGLTPQETGLLRGMARVASLNMRMQRLLEEERAAREGLDGLAREQAGLRRVATLVARGEEPSAVFMAVAEEVGLVVQGADVTLVGRYDSQQRAVELVGGWSGGGDPAFVGSRVDLGGHNVLTRVFESGAPARVDQLADDAPATALAREWARSGAGAPITVEGRLWGVMIVGSLRPEGLPPGIEHQLAGFTELVATAIANAQARDELREVADDQTTLRRVAMLVARRAPPAKIFDAVTEEVHQLFHADVTGLSRYDPDGSWTVLAVRGATTDSIPIGFHPDPGASMPGVADLLAGRSVRVDAAPKAWVASPIVLMGRTWGQIAVFSRQGPLPAGAEERLAHFTELVATAIANAQAREELRTVADEQAALRRVATLVAEGASGVETFSAVAAEAGQLADADAAVVFRYERERTATVVGGWSVPGIEIPTGSRLEVKGTGVAVRVLETHRTARVDRAHGPQGSIAAFFDSVGLRCGVGAPITVEGQLWGVLVVVAAEPERLPAGSERRVAEFTDLLATAIGNAEARGELRTVADEQAALRRVATLVAEGVGAEKLFSAVALEATHVLRVAAATLDRYEPDGAAVTLALSSEPDWEIADSLAAAGTVWPNEPGGLVALVRESGNTTRVDDYSELVGSTGDSARAAGLGSACAAPIVVDGKLWGLIRVYERHGRRLPDDTETRLYGFAELVATALSNADARAELIASRARIVATADETRRRFERDLHDGAQQRLLSLGLRLRAVQAAVPAELDELARDLDEVASGLEGALGELREFARGIHPAILARGGLAPALRFLVRRSAVPAALDVRLDERLPSPVENAAYYIVSEALVNATKHADASGIAVEVEMTGAALHLSIRDDGVGGAAFVPGSGLLGLKDRVEALGGRISLESPRQGGTTIEVELPLRRFAVQDVG
jgi:signal transduction histidine kinase